MRTLMIAFEYPWPADSGSRLRLLSMVHGLGRCGSVDLFSVVPESRTDIDPPDGVRGLDRVGRVTVRPTSIGVAGLAHPLVPAEIPMHDRRRVTRALGRFASGRYDLVWCFDVRAWILSGRPDLAPVVVDLGDLEDYKIRARLAIGATVAGPAPRVRRIPGRAWSTLEAWRWARVQRAASRRVDRTLVCSELDARRAVAGGATRVAVVPNGYPSPDHPAGRPGVGTPPTVLFQGTLRYPPNVDAARWLVDEIAPGLRAEVPDVRIRLVGRGNPAQQSLHQPPATTLVGPVLDMATELGRADVVVVPVRYGSGTRVKIIEAFAHRIPVVSTTLGAEGLGVEDGRELLVADTAAGLATACARVLTDPGLRRRLVDAAYARYLDAFRSDVVEDRVAALAREVVAG